MINESLKLRFESLCKEELSSSDAPAFIGVYNEKRLHKVIKRFVSPDSACHEVKVGSRTADVLINNVIYEIQTKSFAPLKAKIADYLEKTDCDVVVIRPVIAKKQVLRVDAESGELIRSRLSPKKEAPTDILPELIYLSELLGSERLRFEVYSVIAEERVYSDEVHRRRRSGRRDSELFPISLEGIVSLSSREDLLSILPDRLLSLPSFTAAEFSKITKLRGRRAYLALGALAAAGALEKTDGRPARYNVINF